MADNDVLPATGDTIRSVQKGTPKTQVMILDKGGGGAESLLAAGQAAMVASIPVVIASDQSAVPVSGTLTIGSMPSVTIGTIPDVGLVNAGAEGESGRGEVPVKSRSLEASVDAMTEVLLRIEKLLESVVTD